MLLSRPRLTLRVRSLMILVLIVGGVLGWKVRRDALGIQGRATRMMLSRSPVRRTVYYEHQVGPDLQMLLGPDGRILDAHPWAPAWLQNAVGAEYFQEVALVDFLPSDYRWRTTPLPGEETLAAIATLDHLKVLGVGNWMINDAGLARLAGMPRLGRLLLDWHRRSSDSWAGDAVATMPAMLEELELDYSGAKFSRDTVARIARLGRLKRLGLVEPKLSDPAVPLALADLKWLESLDITSSSKAATFLFQSRGLTKLRGLYLPNLVPTDSDLANVAGLTRIEQLDLDYSKITDAGLVYLSGLTRLKALSLSKSHLTDAGMVHLSGMVGLTNLSLTVTPLTDTGVTQLRRLTNLTSLDIRASQLTDAGMAHLAGMKSLNSLCLGTCAPLTDAGMASLAGMSQLQSLHIRGSGVTDRGLAHLKGLERLGTLELPGSSVTGPGLAHLTRGCTISRALNLSKIKANADAAVPHLAKLAGLSSVDLSDTAITVVSLAVLRKALARCKILIAESKQF